MYVHLAVNIDTHKDQFTGQSNEKAWPHQASGDHHTTVPPGIGDAVYKAPTLLTTGHANT